MKKIAWIDTETTGTDETKHGLIQLSCIVEQDFKILGCFDIHIKPFPGELISLDAMEKTGITVEMLKYDDMFKDPKIAFKEFISFIDQFVNRYDPADKFIMGGKNVQFDDRFLRAFFDKNDDIYYGSWFHYPKIDLEHTFAEVMLHEENFSLKRYRLEDICEFLDIELKPHDSMEDIIATRKAYHILNGNEI